MVKLSGNILRRLIAAAIDALAMVTIGWFIWFDSPLDYFWLDTHSLWFASLQVASVQMLLTAYLAAEIFFGGSVGKLAIGLRVARADGHRSSFLLRLGRWLVKSSPWLLVAANTILYGMYGRWLMPTLDDHVHGWIDKALPWLSKPFDCLQEKWGLSLSLLLYVTSSALGVGWLLLLPLIGGEMLVLLPSRRTLIDRLTRTRVIRRGNFSGVADLKSRR